jgi:TRAP-type transport system periplasmic protein
MRLGVSSASNSVQTLTALHLAAAINRRSNGQLKIEVYPSLQLATEQETVQGLTTGVIDLALQSTGFLVQLVPQYQVLSMPFLFKNFASAFRVLDGPIGDQLFADLDAKGILGLSWGTPGFKELETTTKAIVVPEDMKGLRFRIQAGAVYVATYQALGAIPLTIDLSEAFTALSQRTIDGIDTNLDTFTTSKYYTLVKHVAISNHIFAVDALMASKRKTEALPAPLQKVLKEEGKAVVPFWRSLTAKQIAEDIQFLKKNGIAFTEIDYPAFRKAMAPVYAGVQARLGGDLLDRISRAASAT